MGFGPDQVVPLAFHVDYFNTPWKDPLSDPAFTAREAAYGTAKRRKDLFFTPMMMVDGRTPMLGSDRTKAMVAIANALKEPPAVALGLKLSPDPADAKGRKRLEVRVSALSPQVYGRALLVGVGLFEDPVVTNVRAGENAGKRLVDHYAVRTFAYQDTKVDAEEPSVSRTFPIELAAGWDPARCGVGVFVQDWKSGEVFQAGSIRWEDTPHPAAGPRRRRR